MHQFFQILGITDLWIFFTPALIVVELLAVTVGFFLQNKSYKTYLRPSSHLGAKSGSWFIQMILLIFIQKEVSVFSIIFGATKQHILLYSFGYRGHHWKGIGIYNAIVVNFL